MKIFISVFCLLFSLTSWSADLPFGAIPGKQVKVCKGPAPVGNTSCPNYDSSLSLGFFVYLPKDYSEQNAQGYPLVIWLHGYGEKGNGITDLQLVEDKGGLANYVRSTVNNPNGGPLKGQPVMNSIVVSPQGFWGDTKKIPHFESFLNRVSSDLNVDPNRVYIMGWSYGASGTMLYGRTFAARIAAAAPFSGAALNSNNNLLNLVPVWGAGAAYETPASAGGINVLQQMNAVSQTRIPLHYANSSYPWKFNYTAGSSYGTVINSPDVKPAIGVFRPSIGKWVWDINNGAYKDILNDPDVSAVFSVPVSSSHAASWQQAFVSQNFWNWIFAQSKSGVVPPPAPIPTPTPTQPPAVAANVAVNKPVSASSVLTRTVNGAPYSYEAKYAVDGNNTDKNALRWLSTSADPQPTFSIDLQASYKISKLVLYSGFIYANYAVMDFKFQSSNDGINWVDIDGASVVGNVLEKVEIQLPQAVSARHIRFVGSKSRDNVYRVMEIEAWGIP